MSVPTAMDVLLVDDEELTRGILGDLLEKRGYHVDMASTCQEAVALVAHKPADSPYQLALIDMRLPDGLGLDVLKQIKQQSPDTTCLIITAYPDEEQDQASRAAGAHEYLIKPISTKQLMALIEKDILKQFETR